MTMSTLTLAADGSTAAVKTGIELGGRGQYLAFAVAGSLGGGVLKLEFSPDGGSTWLPMEGLTVIPIGAARTVQWPECDLRFTLTGSTSPSLTIYHTQGG